MKGEYYKTQESVQEYIRLAKDVSGKDLIDQLCRIIPSNSEVLEIGSGPGTDWKLLNESYKVIGSDNSVVFLNHLKAQIPNGEFVLLDAITLETHRTFDAIYSNKVLHHLKDQEIKDSIQRQCAVLNPGGIICHSFWKGEGSELFNGLFVNYYSDKSLKELFHTWFEIIVLDSYQEFEPEDSILLIGKKKPLA